MTLLKRGIREQQQLKDCLDFIAQDLNEHPNIVETLLGAGH